MFRLNIGVSKSTFQSLCVNDQPAASAYDYTELDKIMPHPEYAPENFICVLSPGKQTWEKIRALLAEAYDIAVRRFNRRHKNK